MAPGPGGLARCWHCAETPACVAPTESLVENIARVRERIARAEQAADRAPGSVTLVAVSKTQPVEQVAAAIRAGLADLGENRVEEAVPKMTAVAGATVRWHLIGHIQSRKAREVTAGGFALIHSVDSAGLADRLSQLALAAETRLPVLLECNVSGEVTKSGFGAADADQWPDLVPEMRLVAGLRGLEVRGLMTMAPVVARPDEARPVFERLRRLRDFLAARLDCEPWPNLSMGMTDDFEAAIAEGATLVRIGRAIFGERQ